MFLEKRVYQGSSGSVYPHPIVDRVYDERYDRSYQAVFLENRYLKIMILPEIGGRVRRALAAPARSRQRRRAAGRGRHAG